MTCAYNIAELFTCLNIALEHGLKNNINIRLVLMILIWRYFCLNFNILTIGSCLIKDHLSLPLFLITQTFQDKWGRHCCDRMVVGFISTYASSAYHH